MIKHRSWLKALGSLGLYLILSMLMCSNVSAQAFDQHLATLQNSIPPSPTAAALGKYGEWPVSLYTGVPQIDIPIYTVKGRDVNVPISLSYHASGIKVGEISSWVGLGWSLQAGGVITRSVRGIPDEMPSAGYLYFRRLYPNYQDLSLDGPGTPIYGVDATYSGQVYRRVKDSEPDLYSINALGRSFTFYFGRNDSIVTNPYSKLKIYCDQNLSQFTAIMEDGSKLIFGGDGFVEKTYNPGAPSEVPTAALSISSWYLKSITSPQGETINFTYQPQTIAQDAAFSETDYLLISPMGQTKLPKLNLQNLIAYGLILKSIDADQETIFFDEDSMERMDLPGDYALKKIRIFSKRDNATLFEYRFIQSYSSGGAGICPLERCSGKFRYRLHLDELQMWNTTLSTQENRWKFIYNPNPLPSRGSFSQDHWGYYNGNNGNLTLLPAEPYFIGPNHLNGNREANSETTQNEILTQIIYPTGGSTKYNYEQNYYTTPEKVYEKDEIILSFDDLNYQGDNVSYKTQDFQISPQQATQNVILSMNGHYSTMYKQYHQGSLPRATITYPSGKVVGVSANDPNFTGFVALTLDEPGTYTFKLIRTLMNWQTDDPGDSWVTASFYYSKFLGILPVKKLVGGVRVASIEDYDGLSPTPVKRIFTYENPKVIMPIDLMADYLTSYEEGTVIDGSTYDARSSYSVYQVRSSSTKSSLGAIRGGVIGYGKVTTSYGDQAQNGKKVSIFSNDFNVSAINRFPYPPAPDLSNRCGLLLSESIYDKDDHLLKNETSQYQTLEVDYITTYKLGCNRFYYQSVSSGEDSAGAGDGGGGQLTSLDFMSKVYYDIVSERVKLLSKTSTEYGPTGQLLTTSTNYFYDNPNNLEATRIESTDSQGGLHKTVLRTALEKADINNATPLTAKASEAIDAMLSRNIISPVLQQEKYLNDALIERKTMNYALWSNGFVLPSDVSSQIADNPPVTDLTISGYDGYGNENEYIGRDGLIHGFIYDQKYGHPVAEITNGHFSDVSFSSFESPATGGWSIPSSARVSSGITGASSYNLVNGAVSKSGLNNLLNYKLSFWAKSGSVSVTNANVSMGIARNGWTYYEAVISGQTSISLNGTATIDELRLYPATAYLKSFTYDNRGLVTSVTDFNNSTVYYYYDSFGRLKSAFDQDGKLLRSNQYHYKTGSN